MEYEKLSKKALSVLYVTAILQALVLAALPLAVFLVIRANPFAGAYLQAYGWATPVVCTVFPVCGLLWALVTPPVRYRRYRYKIAADRVEIIEGLFFIRRTIVPIDRIHQLDVVRGPLDTRFGVAKVTLTTAGSTATFRFLELARAETIAETLNATIARKLQAKYRQPNGGGDDYVF